MTKILIKRARAYIDGGFSPLDVLVRDDVIAGLGLGLQDSADREIDGAGMLLIPGAIDAHVHFREPGYEHKEDLLTGSKACARGGVTTYFDMPNTKPHTSTKSALHEKFKLAEKKSVVNYSFYAGATNDNIDELKGMRDIPGVKVYLGSSTGGMLLSDYAAFERLFADQPHLIVVHAEDEDQIVENEKNLKDRDDARVHTEIRDAACCLEATRRAIGLARKYRRRVHIAHVSSAIEIPLLEQNQDIVSAESTIWHLMLATEDYDNLGTLMKINPSIKFSSDRDALRQAVGAGTIDIVVTDHAPHLKTEKQQGYRKSPSGMPGVENSLAVMLDQAFRKYCSYEDVVQWMCEKPANIFSVKNKGRIKTGYDADLVLVDPVREETVQDDKQISKCGWSPLHGTKLTGWPIMTMVRGTIVFENGVVKDINAGERATFH
ncbi:MAG: dihydroorotase [Planctomycetes bacterium]|nr:dihydroorotase [Planctomycetota bacterium]